VIPGSAVDATALARLDQGPVPLQEKMTETKEGTTGEIPGEGTTEAGTTDRLREGRITRGRPPGVLTEIWTTEISIVARDNLLTRKIWVTV